MECAYHPFDALPRGRRDSMIELQQLEEMFENISKGPKWDMSAPMLWGYFFTDPSQSKLEAASGLLCRTDTGSSTSTKPRWMKARSLTGASTSSGKKSTRPEACMNGTGSSMALPS